MKILKLEWKSLIYLEKYKEWLREFNRPLFTTDLCYIFVLDPDDSRRSSPQELSPDRVLPYAGQKTERVIKFLRKCIQRKFFENILIQKHVTVGRNLEINNSTKVQLRKQPVKCSRLYYMFICKLRRRLYWRIG